MAVTFAERRRNNNLVALLVIATGALDAISFLGLGGVFTSVMTANMVLLGLSAGRHDAALALHAGVALAGFVTGGLAASRFARPPGEPAPAWPGRVTVALVVEAAVLVAVTVGWETAAGLPRGAEQLMLVAAAAVAMGIQSAAVRALGVPGLSTTYLTGILTEALGDLAAVRASASLRRRLGLLVMLVAGAAVSGVLVAEAPLLAPLVPLALLLAVIVTAAISSP
ncbi:MAG: YoaK family protein [Streptosporangiaceae bacterium]